MEYLRTIRVKIYTIYYNDVGSLQRESSVYIIEVKRNADRDDPSST